MTQSFPATVQDFMTLSWDEIAPLFGELNEHPLNAETVDAWLADWSRLNELIDEAYARLYIDTTLNTTDQDAEARFHAFISDIYPNTEAANQELKRRLLDSSLEPEGFEIPLRNMRAEAELFRAENLSLLTEEQKISSRLNRILGTQTIEWEGETLTLLQAERLQFDNRREVREAAWRKVSQRQLADRDAINALWREYLPLRQKIAENAGFSSFRDYRWRQLLRFSYTPEDCYTFHAAIEEVVVPAAKRVYERRCARLGVESLRPWDLAVDPLGRSALKPFETVQELEEKGEEIFRRVDPALAEYYATMRREGLLDLENRPGKGPGAYSSTLEASKRDFIFMNAVGVRDNVRTLLHESGHAFHAFESFNQPLYHQRVIPMEFAEVASMSMELLAAPYLTKDEGGFYTPEEAARDRIAHLEKIILFWPYMAVVDAFQHWVYENVDAALDPDNCDEQWAALWDRFMVGIDYTGLEPDKRNGWHRKHHIHRLPFYYVEYGLAQLGAVQVWRNALSDQAGAVAAYRRALALGGTADLPTLFETAGARFAFDAGTLGEAVDLIERTIDSLESTV